MGSSTPPSTTQSSTYKMSPEQEQLFATAFPYAKQYASTPIQQFQGSGIAPLTPEELQAQEGYKTAAGTVGNLAGAAAGAQQKLLDPSFMLDPANNPYLQRASNAVTEQVTKNLNENILPGVRSSGIQAGGMYSGGNSASGIAEGKAIGDTNKNLSAALADMMYKAYQGGLGGMQQAVGMNPSVQGQQLMPSDITASVGAQNRSVQQAQLDEMIRKFYTGQELPFLQAQELMSLLTGMPGGTNVSTGTGAVPQVNPMMSTLGGAGTGAAIGSALMPGIGTGVGAGLGALTGFLANRRF